METNNNNKSGGLGFVGALQIVFITLKLLDVIKWSWWWVLAPLWISILATVIIFVVFWVMTK